MRVLYLLLELCTDQTKYTYVGGDGGQEGVGVCDSDMKSESRGRVNKTSGFILLSHMELHVCFFIIPHRHVCVCVSIGL